MSEQINPENQRKSPFYKLVTGNLSIQIIVTLLAVILYAVLMNFLQERTSALIVSAIFIPMYSIMIYTFAWGNAERERNMVLYGHMEEDLNRGLRSGILAVVPILLFSLIVIILAYAGAGANVIGVYRMCTAPFLVFVNPMIEYTPFLIPFVAVFSPFFSWWGYRNGYALYRVWDHLIYKDGVKPGRGVRRDNGPRSRRR